ncbi:MAG TPA: NADH-quinone oxidoreductase subunit I [Armatimonadota bacterium]|nr:NADH-quinone oxidoreductase subunit I [Armatimonadota bacterium]
MAQQNVAELVADVVSGAKSIVDGMRVTLGHVFRKSVTDRYPNKQPEDDYQPGAGYRGMLGLIADPESGELNCTACGQCAKICPDNCIKVTGEGKGKERKAVEFVIDMAKCMYCGLCTEVCPFNAITMTKTYVGAVEKMEDFIWDMDRLTREGESYTEISTVEVE